MAMLPRHIPRSYQPRANYSLHAVSPSPVTMNVSRYWNIVLYRALAGIKAESRQNYLGYAWYLLEPALTATIFYFAFSGLMGRGLDTVMFLLVGLTAWQWYEGSTLAAAGAIKAKLHILQHFDLPKFLFPLVTVLVGTWKSLCIGLVIIIGYLAVGKNHWPAWSFLWLPLVFGCQLLLIISLAIPLSIAATYVNDTLTFAASVFRVLYFLSGIFFSSSIVPPALLGAFYANPMAGLIEAYRAVLIERQTPNLHALLYAVLVGGVQLGLGLLLSVRVNRRILKHVSL
jgi:ABC-type polysaccharide/polyol phosphate export permease